MPGYVMMEPLTVLSCWNWSYRLQVQVAALEILPCIPPHKLRSLMAPGSAFPATLTRQMSTSVKDVSAAAISALGACLSDPLTSDQLAVIQNIAATAKSWAAIIAEALLDPSQLLAASACSAARYLPPAPLLNNPDPHDCQYQAWLEKKNSRLF
jgi:hypothetical protein